MICEICGKEKKVHQKRNRYYGRLMDVCYECVEDGVPICAYDYLQYPTIDINKTEIQIAGATPQRLFQHDTKDHGIRTNAWKIIGKANEIMRSHNNYTIKHVEFYIKYGRPLKLKIWVTDIKNKEAFYRNAQGTVYNVTAEDNLYYYNFIDIEEF